jgi:hypothetical protein
MQFLKFAHLTSYYKIVAVFGVPCKVVAGIHSHTSLDAQDHYIDDYYILHTKVCR